MKAKYKEALRRVLVHEGGKVDDPRDPGGRTNQGVTQATFNAFLRKAGKPTRDVFTMTNAERDAIYKKQYWDAVRGDDLPAGIDYFLFDGAVNSGPSQAIKWLQRALEIRADGQMGMLTMEAIENNGDHDLLIAKMSDKRMAFLKALKHWPTYKKGWTSRVTNVRQTAQAWASGTVGPEPIHVDEGAKKARIEDAKKLPRSTGAGATTGTGATVAVGTQIVNQAKDQLEPLKDVSYIPEIMAIITIVGVVIFAVGLIYRWRVNKKREELVDALGLESA